MPLDPDEFDSLGQNQGGGSSGGYEGKNDGGAAGKLFQQHPESGGPFGGRDNALTALVGYLRRKRMDFDAARWMASQWNREFCLPPISDEEVREKIGRKWHEWKEGEEADATPEEFQEKKPEAWEILSAKDLLERAESGGGTQWLVPDVLVKGGLHFITAPPGVAKSWLMLDLARCVSQGGLWMDKYEIEAGNVVYVDEEMGPADVSTRIRKLQYEITADFAYLGKQQFRIASAKDRKQLVELCKARQTTLVCFDTLAAIWPGLKENDASEVTMLRSYFKEISMTGATVVVAHHDRKSGVGEDGSQQNRIAGSRDFVAMADMTYGIDKKSAYFHIQYGKNRHLPDDKALTLDFTLEDIDEGQHIQIRTIESDERSDIVLSGFEGKVTNLVRLSGPMNSQAICDNVRGSTSALTTVLGRLVDKGILEVTKEGKSKMYRYIGE